MAKKIEWESVFEKALQRSEKEGKPVLLDFFNPGWIGCQQMDAVTYPKDAVVEFVSENLIPLRVQFNEEPLASQFRVKWTPTLVVLDEKGEEHHRTVGFFEPNQFIPSQMLGIAKVAFDGDEFKTALEYLERLLKDYPESNSAPEAIYLRGVSLYKSTKDPKPLKAVYEKLADAYPGSEWTNRAYPYSLL